MMTEATKAKKVKAQETKIAELERKEAAIKKLGSVQAELRHERALLGVLRNAPTSDGVHEDEYDGSPEAVAAGVAADQESLPLANA